MIFLLTGQPGSGKTTIGKMIKDDFTPSIQIDGDDLRKMTKNMDYSESGRRANVDKAHELAAIAHQNGHNVVISLVSPYKDQRDNFKKMYWAKEIYVHTTDDRGRNDFHVANYEPPTENFIDLDTTGLTVEESYNKFRKSLNEFKY